MATTYRGYRHDPAWQQVPREDAYLAGTIADLDRLSERLRRAAVLVDVGEVHWPTELIADAINELTDLGLPLLHLYYVDKATARIRQVANAGSDDLDVVRRHMLDALEFLAGRQTATLVWLPGEPGAG